MKRPGGWSATTSPAGLADQFESVVPLVAGHLERALGKLVDEPITRVAAPGQCAGDRRLGPLPDLWVIAGEALFDLLRLLRRGGFRVVHEEREQQCRLRLRVPAKQAQHGDVVVRGQVSEDREQTDEVELARADRQQVETC